VAKKAGTGAVTKKLPQVVVKEVIAQPPLTPSVCFSDSTSNPQAGELIHMSMVAVAGPFCSK
jgi:hypothetical protein